MDVELPNPETLEWITVGSPHARASLPCAEQLGAGEMESLALALEQESNVAILDDRLAR